MKEILKDILLALVGIYIGYTLALMNEFIYYNDEWNTTVERIDETVEQSTSGITD